MDKPRVYADFGHCSNAPGHPPRRAIILETVDTLRNLSNAGIYLREAMPLSGVDWSGDTEDLEGHGTARYDDTNHRWLLELDSQGVRHVPVGSRVTPTTFLCAKCRTDLSPQLTAGLSRDDDCPTCGSLIYAPLSPPPRPSPLHRTLERLSGWGVFLELLFLAALVVSGLILWLVTRAG